MTEQKPEEKVVAPGFNWRGHEFGEFTKPTKGSAMWAWVHVGHENYRSVHEQCAQSESETLDVGIRCEEPKPGILLFQAVTTHGAQVDSEWKPDPSSALDDLAIKIESHDRRYCELCRRGLEAAKERQV